MHSKGLQWNGLHPIYGLFLNHCIVQNTDMNIMSLNTNGQNGTLSPCQMKNGIQVKQKFNRYFIWIKRHEKLMIDSYYSFSLMLWRTNLLHPRHYLFWDTKNWKIKKLLSVSSFYFRRVILYNLNVYLAI